jgi:hypothetical protein
MDCFKTGNARPSTPFPSQCSKFAKPHGAFQSEAKTRSFKSGKLTVMTVSTLLKWCVDSAILC